MAAITHRQKQIELHRRLAGVYDLRYGPKYARLFQEHWNNAILEEVPKGERSVVLDLGCGVGILLEAFGDKYCHVYGMDISIDMLKRVPRTHRWIKGIVAGDASTLPFLSATFDVVVCRSSLHHNRLFLDSVLKEIHRILKEGGCLIVSEPSNDSVLVRVARTIMYKKLSKFDENDRGFLSEELFGLLKAHDFSLKKVKRFGFLSYTFAGFPDILPILQYLPFNRLITRLLIAVDGFLATFPGIRGQSLHIIAVAQKR